MNPELDIALRLGAATLMGAVIGLNRDLHGKPTGVRTLGLVGLGSALVVLASTDFLATLPSVDANPVIRAIQGVLTGIGFLGAGVIVRGSGGRVGAWNGICTGSPMGIKAKPGRAGRRDRNGWGSAGRRFPWKSIAQ